VTSGRTFDPAQAASSASGLLSEILGMSWYVISTFDSRLASTRRCEQLSMFTLTYNVPHFEWSEPPNVSAVLLALAVILLPWSLIGWLIATIV
jgi:hypothetical protein